jgi:hypothetical protein
VDNVVDGVDRIVSGNGFITHSLPWPIFDHLLFLREIMNVRNIAGF